MRRWQKSFPIVGILIVVCLTLSSFALTAVARRGDDGRGIASSTGVGVRSGLVAGSRLPGTDKSDFPRLVQDARFTGGDRVGYGAAASGKRLAYVESQGAPGGSGDGAVVVQTLSSDSNGVSAWSGDADNASAPAGSVRIAAPAAVSGFGYQVALNDQYVVVGAKWSQEVLVFDLSGALARTIDAPADSDRYEVDNFGESLALDGNSLAIGAPNSTVDDVDDAGMGFVVDLSDAASVPTPLLAPKGDASIVEGALAGQTVAVHGGSVALGAPGQERTVAGVDSLTGGVQLFSGSRFVRDLNVDESQGSYPAADASTARAGLGRSLAFSSDGGQVLAGDPSWDSSTPWTEQRGVVYRFDVADGSVNSTLKGTEGTQYFGSSVAVGDAPGGSDTVFVGYRAGAGAGRVAGYAVPATGGEAQRATFQPLDVAGEDGFGSLGLLGGALVANTFTENGVGYRNLLVSARGGVYHFGTPIPLKLSKSAGRTEGSRVFPGQRLTYTLTAVNPNRGPVETALTDDLSGVLPYSRSGTVDNVTVSTDPAGAAPGAPVVDTDAARLTWKGAVPGESAQGPGKVTVAYSVTVLRSQDASYYQGSIENTFVSDYSQDEPKTSNGLGRIDVDKRLLAVSSDGALTPVAEASSVAFGQQYVYEMTVSNPMPADAIADPVDVTVSDDMHDVVDDASVENASLAGDSPIGAVTWDDASSPGKVVWKGTLDKGQQAVVRIQVTTYPADHSPAGDHRLINQAMNDRGPDSVSVKNDVSTVDLGKGAFGSATSSDGVSSVRKGKDLFYRVTYRNSTGVTVYDASLKDDLSGVLGSAGKPMDLSAVSSVTDHKLAAPIFDQASGVLSWSDSSGVAPGETVTVSYRVTVKSDAHSGSSLVNGVQSPQSVQRPTTRVNVQGMDPVSHLPFTGGSRALWLVLALILGVFLVCAGYAANRYTSRR